ncbi:hypothetical protein ATH84_104024 [Paracoccus versutus]|uniref:Uncharacterized protein n=1 Tax=Paracoccus versutus TaxID=34007 RepID=A0AAQ0HEQ7_PARVE|nr:hypothetical protein ATH84_104024 [Paracoccus versutus]
MKAEGGKVEFIDDADNAALPFQQVIGSHRGGCRWYRQGASSPLPREPRTAEGGSLV